MAIDVSVFRLEQFHSELPGLGLLLRLLPPQRHLGRHHPLALRDEGALGTQAVPPPAVALVSLHKVKELSLLSAKLFETAVKKNIYYS